MRLAIPKYSFLIILGSFFLAVILGIILLTVYKSTHTPVNIVDIVLTSVSIITGTGASTVPFVNLTQYGKIILILLMYIGSIGILTIILSVMLLFTHAIEWYGIAIGIFDIININSIYTFLKTIFVVSLAAQITGVSGFFLVAHNTGFSLSIVDALFLSMNFFCNIGFGITNYFPKKFIDNSLFYTLSTVIMIIGSLGFLFFFEVYGYIKQKIIKKIYSFSLTFYLLLIIYFASLIFFWILYFFTCEQSLTFLSFIRSLFAATSLRACGISPYQNIPLSIIFISSLYGILGTCPFGTGGGLKTSIIGVIFYTFLSFFKKYRGVSIKSRVLPWGIVAFAHIFIFYIPFLALLISIIIDYYTNHTINFLLIYSDILGLVTGAGAPWTTLIETIGSGTKIFFLIIMATAKISIISLMFSVNKVKKNDVEYPDAKIIL